MKLHLSVLEKLIALPSRDVHDLRQLFDDVGLEVKDCSGDTFEKTVFNIETLANRGDHLSALGVARELSARFLTPIKVPGVVAQLPERKASVPVRIESPLCSRYGLLDLNLPHGMRMQSDVATVMVNAESASSTERHAIVHVLNYILLELGQPMHAFDRDKIDGEIVVSTLSVAETVEALDGKTYEVPVGSLVIRDKKKIVAVAGVIGCANSMVTTSTTKALIESACFDPISVRKTARAMGISTEASYAFERGSDIEHVQFALRRLVYLTSVGAAAAESAQMSGFTLVENGEIEKRTLVLKLDRVRKQLHAPRLEMAEVQARLKNLGYVLAPPSTEKELHVVVPTWRLWDVHTEEDLIEDFARSHGLNKIRLQLPALDYETPEEHAQEEFLRRVEPALIGAGFFEVITKGFYSRKEVDLIERMVPGTAAQHVEIRNALDRGYSHMKLSNALHLALLAERNQRQGILGCKFYEFGRLFNKPSADAKKRIYDYERDTLTLGFSGRWSDNEWRKPEALEEKVRLLKGVLESVARALGVSFSYGPGKNGLLHPGYQANIKAGREVIGCFGVLHPEVATALEVGEAFLYAELDAEPLFRLMKPTQAGTVCEFPSIRRDLTLRMPLKEFSSRVSKAMFEAELPNLAEVIVVDDFRRNEEEFRRTSFRLTFRNAERTLSHDEVDAAMARLLQTLQEQHQIGLA